mgnify:CR=1 FL=1
MQGDAASLHRLAVILLDNAIKYTGTGGAVTLRLAAAGSQAVLTVHNTGTPIPPDRLPHIFERFYRADPIPHRQRNRAGAGDYTKHLPGTPRRYPGGIRAGWHDIPGRNQERAR